MSVKIPCTADDLTSEWLSAVLATDVTMNAVRRFGEGVGLLSEIYRLEIDGAGLPPTVVVKLSVSDEASRSSATTFRMYEREVRFFQLLAPGTPIRTPKCFFADWDAQTEDSVILMEDLSQLRAGDQLAGLTSDDAAAGLTQMAALHAHWWEDPKLDELAWAGTLLDPTYYEGVPMGFELLLPAAMDHFGHVLTPTNVALLERLKPHINKIQDRLGSSPRTLLHGDFRGDNLLFDDESGTSAVVDWQAVVVGRGAQELAYFIGQSLTPEERRKYEHDLVDSYVSDLRRGGVVGYDFNDCWSDYRFGVAYAFAYGVLMAGLNVADQANFRKIEAIVERMAAAADDLEVATLIL